jgi:hypothetical protein
VTCLPAITLDFMQCCCLIRVCYVVSCDWMTIGDELGRKWEEAVIACVKGLGSVNTCVFFRSRYHEKMEG